MKRPFIFTLLTTIAFIMISWIASVAGGLNQKYAYPKSLYMAYASQKNTTYEIEKKESYSLEKSNELEISTFAVNVRLEKNTANTLDVTLSGNFPDIESALKQEKLANLIRLSTGEFGYGTRKFSLSLNPDGEGTMTVKVPAGVKDISVKTGSGNVEVYNQALNRVKIHTYSGNAKVSGSKLRDLTFDSSSGDMTVDNSAIELTEMKALSGDIKILSNAPSPIMILETSSGDVNLEFHAQPDLNINFSTINGGFDLDPSFGKVDDWKRDVSVRLGSGKGRVSLKTYSGTLKVKRF